MSKEPEEKSNRLEASSPDTEKQTPLQQSQEALKQLHNDFNAFIPTYQALLSDDVGKPVHEKLSAGRFTTGTLDRVGIKGEQAHVVYGDWTPGGNMEGSLYTIFDDNIVRVRWAGDFAMYLNGWGNYMRLGQSDKGYTVTPKRIDGQFIMRITEKGVETLGHDVYFAYDNAMDKYEMALERERGLGGMIRRNVRRVLRKPVEIPQPVEPEPIIIPHENFIAMVGTMRDGLQRTLHTIRQARGV